LFVSIFAFCAGLDYAKQVGLELVKKQFQTIKVPDQSGSAPASILGTINWSLTSIVLSGLSFSNSSSVVIQPNTGIAISLYVVNTPQERAESGC
jgi:hypothetical protein